MSSDAPIDPRNRDASAPVVIVGGGLAGLAAALALAEHNVPVVVYEARRQLGGRASSFRDPDSGDWVDHCQHVSMACCTNLADFVRRLDLDDCFERVRELNFFTPDGQRYDFVASRWLPAPLHLAPALWRLRYLSVRDRLAIGLAVARLARWRPASSTPPPTVLEWLRAQGQSAAAIEGFWSVVLVSALGETLDRASLVYARKVFVDGFMRHRDAYELEVPRVPLGELYGDLLSQRLNARGVVIRYGAEVEEIEVEQPAAEPSTVGNLRVRNVRLRDGSEQACRAAIVAVPWRQVGRLFSDDVRVHVPALDQAAALTASPITGVHLWFDRPINDLQQAVLIRSLSQWVFHHPSTVPGEHYYQVVISAAHEQTVRSGLVEQVVADLRSVWSTARTAQLVRQRVITAPQAVFSVDPLSDALRPAAATPLANLALAGDWTATGWPATMEGAVRSGYRAAEVILASEQRPARVVVPGLPSARLPRWLRWVTPDDGD